MKEIQFNWKYSKAFEPVFSFKGRYIALTGGRASGKSWFLAHYFLDLLLYKKADLLCAREFQNSISESNYKLFKNIIDKYKLPYEVQSTRIKSLTTGSQIVFIGLSDVTADNVKSFEDFKFVWLEEAQKISKKSWETLNPTIRTENAQIFISMNPEISHKKHPIMSELLSIYKENSLHLHINYNQNPFVSPDIIEMAELTKKNKPDDYNRIWLGIPEDTSVNTVVKHFTDDNIAELYYCPDETLHITCDFNVNPMCWCLAHVTKEKVYFFDEIVLENVTTEDTTQELIRRYPDHKAPIIINGDAAGTFRSTQSEIDNYMIMVNALKRHYPENAIHVVVRPSNPRIKHRITVWNSMVLDARGKRRILIDKRCKWLLYNMEELKYKVGTDIIDLPTHQNLRDDNEKRYLMHIFDAASYLVERYFLIKRESGEVVYSEK